MVKLTIIASTGGSVEYEVVDPYTGYRWTGVVDENKHTSLEVTTGASATVLAKPKTGYKFYRWTYYVYYDTRYGYGESFENPYSRTIDYRTSITAQFSEAPAETVRVYWKVGSGLGSVCVDSKCTSSGYYQHIDVAKGSTITVDARPSEGYEFDKAYVDTKTYTSIPFKLTVTTDIWISVDFKLKPSEVKITSFTSSPNAGYAPLTVTFNASWSGGSPPYTVEMRYGDGYSDSKTTNYTSESFSHTYTTAGTFTATVTVRDSRGQTASKSTAIDVRPTPTYVALTVYGAEGGTIYFRGESFRAGQSKIYQLQAGETVELTQTADSGYKFSRWVVDSKTDTSQVLRFTITTHTSVSAVFEKITPTPTPTPTIPTPTPTPTPTKTPTPTAPTPTPTWEQMMPLIAMGGALLIGATIVISLVRG